MVINITDTLILHVLKSNYKTNFTIFLFIFAVLKIDSFYNIIQYISSSKVQRIEDNKVRKSLTVRQKTELLH